MTHFFCLILNDLSLLQQLPKVSNTVTIQCKTTTTNFSWDRDLYSSGWPWTPFVGRTALGYLVLLPLPYECQDHRHALPCLVYAVVGVKPRAWCMLGNDFTIWAPSLASWFTYSKRSFLKPSSVCLQSSNFCPWSHDPFSLAPLSPRGSSLPALPWQIPARSKQSLLQLTPESKSSGRVRGSFPYSAWTNGAPCSSVRPDRHTPLLLVSRAHMSYL